MRGTPLFFYALSAAGFSRRAGSSGRAWRVRFNPTGAKMKLRVLLVLLFLSWLTVRPATADTTLETDTFRWVIADDGANVSLFDKTGNAEYLDAETRSYCAQAKKGDELFPAESARFDGRTLTLSFQNGAVVAELRVTPRSGALILEVASVRGEPDELIFASVPLMLDAKPFEPFAACALALTPFTHVQQLPALQTEFRARATARFGLVGAKAALVGVPQAEILPAIRRVMTGDAAGFPISDKGGAWALDSPDGHGSYLMNFGTLTEETADSWIESCRRLGFNQIDNHGGEFFRFGSLDNVQPGGWDSFKKVADRCHAAGIQVILHTYSCFISQNDRYVTPVPHPDLDTWREWTLAEPVSPDATEITVAEPLDGDLLQKGWSATSSRTLRLGDEIVEYENVTREAPWKFLGCKRGFHGTEAAAHEKGSAASLLKTYWGGLYVPKLESPLWFEIAANHADVTNKCGFDGLYFDAIDGLNRMWGNEDYWYYAGKFVLEVARRLDRPVGMEFSAMIHPWWHYRSRYQAWDSPNRGFKRFLDLHIGLIKGAPSYQRGSEIDQFAASRDGRFYLPLQLGWWKFVRWGNPKDEPTYGDDVDYVGCKLVGNRAGFSFNHPVDVSRIDADPFLADSIGRLREYARVRDSDLDEATREKLRAPRKEYRLFYDEEGAPRFRETFYKRHRVTRADDASAAWTVVNEFGAQPLSARIAALYAPDDGGDAPPIRFDPAAAGRCEGADGVTGNVEPNAGTVPATGQSAFALTASNAGRVADEAAWLKTAPSRLPEGIPADSLAATGFWLCGDGKGEVLNVRIGTCCHLVTIDFTGWRYIELLEPDSTRVLDYVWPGPVVSYYSLFRESGDRSVCELWYNNIPAGETVRCLFGPIAAFRHREYELKNPSIAVGGKRVLFPTTLESGAYLELRGGKCVKYDKTGAPVGEVVPEGEIPALEPGPNDVRFSAETGGGNPSRAEVTLIGEGEVLPSGAP